MSLLTSFHTFLDSDDWVIDSVGSFLASSINEKINGQTPLSRVLQNHKCSFEIVKLLLDYGAEVNYRNDTEDSPLYLGLINFRDEAIIEALLLKGGKLKENDEPFLGTTYICAALRHGASKGIIKLLLDAGSSPDACRRHETALRCATSFPNYGLKEGVLELLIESGAQLNVFSFRSPICYALIARCGAQDIQLLIRNELALNDCRRHRSPWFCATDPDDCKFLLKTDIVKVIHEAGFPTDVLNEDGWSPLQCALLDCDYQTGAIELMIKELGVQGFNENGSLLHIAVTNNNCKLEIVKLLVEAGLSVNQQNEGGEIPLHRAVMSMSGNNLSNILKYLLEKGSTVDSKDKAGVTLLRRLVSCSRNCSDIKLLLEAGATVDSGTLKFTFRQYKDIPRSNSSDVIKMLLKFSFLRNTDFQIGEFIEDLQDKAEWMEFAAECVREVQKLDSEFLSCKHSLRDLVLGTCKHLTYDDNAHSEANDCNFKQFVKIVANNTFNLYFGHASAKVDKELLKYQLQTRSVYTTTVCGKRKIALDNDSLIWLTRDLSQEDLVNMIIAYDS